ncbi:MAG TPA: DnaJ C-terminal domain-containing protein [Kofleriaceae bacterium]|nr:DnaJ C-terminal domain-containing protein [Kofleriaceae bacterium]
MARRRKRDYYEVLGVSRDADDVELKRAFRDLARKYHPDINSGPEAEDRFKEANEAYAMLSDPKQRGRYDRYGHAGIDPNAAPQGFGSVKDVFDEILGDIRRRRQKRKAGRDLRYTLEVTFEEAALGCTKTIRVPVTDDEGEVIREKEFSVSVPAGAKEGAVKMIRGEGELGRAGGVPGDLHVIMRIKEHPVFRREGSEVWCDVPISFTQAALGAVIEVPTLDGNVRMRVPEGTQSGRVFRIRGRGLIKGGGGKARGDQMVRVQLETPANLTTRQRELLQELASERGEDVAHPQRKGILDKVRELF